MPPGIGYPPPIKALGFKARAPIEQLPFPLAPVQDGMLTSPDDFKQRRLQEFLDSPRQESPGRLIADDLFKKLNAMIDPYLAHRPEGEPGHSPALDTPMFEKANRDIGYSTPDPAGGEVPETRGFGPTPREVADFAARDMTGIRGVDEFMFDRLAGPLMGMIPMGRMRAVKELGLPESVNTIQPASGEKIIREAIGAAGDDLTPGVQAYARTQELRGAAGQTNKALDRIEAGTLTAAAREEQGKIRRALARGKVKLEKEMPSHKALEAMDAERAAREATMGDVLDEKDFLVFDERKRARLAQQRDQLGEPVSDEFGRSNFPREREGELFSYPTGRNDKPQFRAAWKLPGGRVISGARGEAHIDLVERIPDESLDFHKLSDGFIDENGDFLTRKELGDILGEESLSPTGVGAESLKTNYMQRTRFAEGGRGDIALPHGVTSDGMSSAERRARMDGGRLPTAEEYESWVDYTYAEQGRNLPISTRRVLQSWEPKDLVDKTFEAITKGDITAEGRKWYSLFNRKMKEIIGEKNVPEFAAVWAFLSPQNPVEANLRDAFAAMRFAREYDVALKKAGKEWNNIEFARAFAAELRRFSEASWTKKFDKAVARGKTPPNPPAAFSMLGKLGKGGEGSTTFSFKQGNLRPAKDLDLSQEHVARLSRGGADRADVGPGAPEPQIMTRSEGQATPEDVALKISEFYRTGVLKGDLKIKSFDMTTGLRDELGGAATSTNDVRIGGWFGFDEMIENDGYVAIQHLAAMTAREVSNRLGYRVSTDEVQALWWAMGESVGGNKRMMDRLGDLWPHKQGTLDSAIAFAGPEIKRFEKWVTDEPFLKGAGKYEMAPQIAGRSEFPMNVQMFTTHTRDQLMDMPAATRGVNLDFSKEEKEQSAQFLQTLGKGIRAKFGLTK